MTDIFDLEAEMNGASSHGPDWDAKVDRARARVAEFNALNIREQLAILNPQENP